ncbi:glutamate 5-kinase [Candidatus Marinamargulisbacteria bacterium SCGC AG-343-D04]|nr:glutamate 5-kinase [Candidatus Marinamargulisbacteria bacterium SCGC AG-343-D04]
MKRIVIKIGSKLLTTESNKLDLNNLRTIVDGVSYLYHKKNIECILVSSGAITCGSEVLNISPKTIPQKQAAASIGQLLLLKEYGQFFGVNGINIGQILLTKDILDHGEKYKNAKNTINTLLKNTVIPIINENDSVAIDEIKFGDNDLLSSYVATLMEANLLVILTDQDGVYDKNPHQHSNARLLTLLHDIPSDMIDRASDALDSKGKGGIKSKLMAAKYCLEHNIPTIVANGKDSSILKKIINDKKGGTWITTK